MRSGKARFCSGMSSILTPLMAVAPRKRAPLPKKILTPWTTARLPTKMARLPRRPMVRSLTRRIRTRTPRRPKMARLKKATVRTRTTMSSMTARFRCPPWKPQSKTALSQPSIQLLKLMGAFASCRNGGLTVHRTTGRSIRSSMRNMKMHAMRLSSWLIRSS